MAKVTAASLQPVHTRTGRACLDWSNSKLGEAAGLSPAAIRKFESDRGASEAAKQSMIDALEAAGVVLYNGGKPGARLMGKPKASC